MRMDNRASIHKYFQEKDQLTFTNEWYKSLVDDLFAWLLKSDQIKEDLTTKSLFHDINKSAQAHIITRQETTIAGLEEIDYLIRTFTDLSTKLLCKDGATAE